MSCEIGAVRLSEALPELLGKRGTVAPTTLHEARARARDALRVLTDFENTGRLIFVGGTATTSISILRGRREEIEAAPLSFADVERLIHRLASTRLDQRKDIPGMNPQRADILLAGTLILEAAFELTHHGRALVTSGDLLLGYLLRHGNG